MLLWSRVIINKIQMVFTGIATRKENKDQEEEIVTKRQVRRGIGKFFRSAQCLIKRGIWENEDTESTATLKEQILVARLAGLCFLRTFKMAEGHLPCTSTNAHKRISSKSVYKSTIRND